MAVKITSFEAENFKRIRAVRFEPTADGLTVIGGNNAEGKTSVLDAIAFALGGKKYAPEHPTRDGSVVPGRIELTLSNGLKVTRKGKNASLTVTDPTGAKSGQTLLDSFVSTFALDLPKFLDASDKDKVNVLLKTLGIEEELDRVERAIKAAFDDRAFKRKVMDAAAAKAENLPTFEDAPEEEINVAELTAELLEANRHNGEIQNAALRAERAQRDAEAKEARISELEMEIDRLRKEAAASKESAKSILDNMQEPVDTEPLMERMSEAGSLNDKFTANAKAAEARAEADRKAQEFADAEKALESARAAKAALLDPAKMPVRGLSVEDGMLCYNGHPWKEMSGAEQLVVATAIVQKTAPDCGFILMDKLEQMDADTLRKFGEWAERKELQIIATRVSTGSECTIVIEDGEVAEAAEAIEATGATEIEGEDDGPDTDDYVF